MLPGQLLEGQRGSMAVWVGEERMADRVERFGESDRGRSVRGKSSLRTLTSSPPSPEMVRIRGQ